MRLRRATNPASHRLARLGFLLGLLAAVGVAAVGPLYRFGRIDLETVVLALRYGGLTAIAAILLSVITAVICRPGEGRRGFVSGMLGVCLGVAGAWLPVQWAVLSATLPKIHDISTDTSDPPVLSTRRDGTVVPIPYDTRRVADLQKEGYPDLAPLLLSIPAAEAFARAEKAAAAMGWQIVEADAASGRIQAVAQTLWFGFQDDVAIRIRPTAAGSRIDMRSSSRVGISDLGANAERIRRFFHRISG
jgi:uncharacterized protein (DUF1499 family)